MLNVGSPHARMSKRIDRIIIEISAVSTQLGFKLSVQRTHPL
jgi:hypothetical protein